MKTAQEWLNEPFFTDCHVTVGDIQAIQADALKSDMGIPISHQTACLRTGCGRPQYSRGLCSGCYQVATQLVRNGTTTWLNLTASGKCSPLQKQRERGTIRAWFLGDESLIRECPFCGTKAARTNITGDQCIQIECENCGARGPTSGEECDATRYWNERNDDRVNSNELSKVFQNYVVADQSQPC